VHCPPRSYATGRGDTPVAGSLRRQGQSGRPASGCSAFTLNRNHQPDQFTPTPTSSQEFLPAHRALSSEIFPAEETFKLKLGPRHKVSLCTVSYILNFPGKVSVETSPACGCNKRPGAAQSQPPPAWRFLRRSP